MIIEETQIYGQELNIMSTLDGIAQYRLNWWEHLCRMSYCHPQTTMEPVSYTHLDVYKRQYYSWSLQRFLERPIPLRPLGL